MIHDSVSSKSFGLYNDDEQLIGLMTSIKGNPLFQLHNKQGVPRLICMINQEGNPQINLVTVEGNTLAALHVDTDQSARFVLCTDKNIPLLEIATNQETTTITIRNAQDEVVRTL